MKMKLIIGEKYDFERIREVCIGWTDGNDHDDMSLDYFFSHEGEYLGPDEDGVEPELGAIPAAELAEFLAEQS